MGKLKVKENQIEIIEKDEQFWTTSLDIAEKFGKRHDNVLRDIERLECSEKFRLLNFEESSYQNEQKKDQKSYIISCRGFQRLGMSFTGQKAAEWKEKYIDAFEEMKDKLIRSARQNEKRITQEWKQLREEGKIDRRTGTDALKRFVDYALSHGSSNKKWFSLLTEAKYDAIIIPGGHMEIRRRKKESGTENGVDTLTFEELKRNSTMDLLAHKIIDEAWINDEDHHKLYKLITGNFKQYGNMVNVMFLPLTSQPIPLTLEK